MALRRKGLSPFLKFVLFVIIIGGSMFSYFKFRDKIIPQNKQTGSVIAQKPTVSVPPDATKYDFATAPTLIQTINLWIGYVGGIYMNNGSTEPSEQSLFWTLFKVKVRFIIQDIPSAAKASWNNNETHSYWQTLDAFPCQVAGIMSEQPQVNFFIDWSRGGDLCIVTRDILKVGDLRGQKVACAMSVPSNTLLLRMLEANGMTLKDIQVVWVESALEAVKLFRNGEVKGAVIWTPDDQDLMKTEVPGSHVIWSTEHSNYIIADILPVKKSFVQERYPEYKRFVAGWLYGNAVLNSNRQVKEEMISKTATFFNVPQEFIRATIDKARLATLGDNLNFFGLNVNYTGMTGRRLYEESGSLYNKAIHQGMPLAPKNLPDFRLISDPSILTAIKNDGWLTGPMHEAEVRSDLPPAPFTSEEAKAIATKPAPVNFAVNSSMLDAIAMNIIDKEFVPIARASTGFYILLEGNTDATGSDAINIPLSRSRAEAVMQYMIKQYGFSRTRFLKPVGNGSRNPVADNDTDLGRSQNRRTEMKMVSPQNR